MLRIGGAALLKQGSHWMAQPVMNTWTVGEWAPGAWGWIISYHTDVADPAEMAHLDYKGRAVPPTV